MVETAMELIRDTDVILVACPSKPREQDTVGINVRNPRGCTVLTSGCLVPISVGSAWIELPA